MILFIDTATEIANVNIIALKDLMVVGNTTIAEKNMISEKLLLTIDSLLKNLSLTKESLRLVIVNGGPGSFTGVRIGTTAANFLAFSLNIPVLAISAKKEAMEQIKELPLQNLPKTFVFPVMPIYGYPPKITTPKTGRLG